jgi:hypothetical protein
LSAVVGVVGVVVVVVAMKVEVLLNIVGQVGKDRGRLGENDMFGGQLGMVNPNT